MHQIWHSHKAADVITCTNFLVIGQGVWILWGCHLSLTKPVAVDTGLALYGAARDNNSIIFLINSITGST